MASPLPLLPVALALCWFAGSTLNNVATKATMSVFPYPMTVVLAGLLAQITLLLGFRACARRSASTAAGSSAGAAAGASSAAAAAAAAQPARRPRLPDMLVAGLAAVTALVCHRVALKLSSVSLTLTVKSVSTALTAVLSKVVLGDAIPNRAWAAGTCRRLCETGTATLRNTWNRFGRRGGDHGRRRVFLNARS